MARERHWNWTAQEKRELATRSGDIMQSLPSVTAESVLRGDGNRCNAVVAWGDGLKPFKIAASADERCRAMDEFHAPFEVQELLRGSQATTVADWEGGAAISITPDKVRQRSSDPAIRCAASIEATVRLDLGSFFPRSIEGKVVGDGCELRGAPVVQYGGAANAQMRSTFRKGASFRMVFQLQKDKFGNEAKQLLDLHEPALPDALGIGFGRNRLLGPPDACQNRRTSVGERHQRPARGSSAPIRRSPSTRPINRPRATHPLP